jgi:hypothetical protein
MTGTVSYIASNKRFVAGHTDLLRIKAETGRTLKTLTVQADQNDPFTVGEGARRDHAQWFADLWHRFEFGSGVHLRRIHYALVSQSPTFLLRDGKPYLNTDICQQKLIWGARDARYLNLVPASERGIYLPR